jgi:hypothetical protein
VLNILVVINIEHIVYAILTSFVGIKQGDYVIKREFTPSGVPITLVHKSNIKAEEG